MKLITVLYMFFLHTCPALEGAVDAISALCDETSIGGVWDLLQKLSSVWYLKRNQQQQQYSDIW